MGGLLVFCGGTDACNALGDSSWRKAGFPSPMTALLSELGLDAGEPAVLEGAAGDVVRVRWK